MSNVFELRQRCIGSQRCNRYQYGYRYQLYLMTYIPSCSISLRRYGFICLCFLTKSTGLSSRFSKYRFSLTTRNAFESISTHISTSLSSFCSSLISSVNCLRHLLAFSKQYRFISPHIGELTVMIQPFSTLSTENWVLVGSTIHHPIIHFIG